jgi:hypothetical protein
MTTSIEYCTKASCIMEEQEKILRVSKLNGCKTNWYSRLFSKVIIVFVCLCLFEVARSRP